VAAAARTSIAATSCHTCNTCQKITQLSVFTTTGRRRRCGLQLRKPLPTSSNGVGCSSKEHHTTSNSNSRRRCSAMASAGLSMHSEKPIPSVPVMPRSTVRQVLRQPRPPRPPQLGPRLPRLPRLLQREHLLLRLLLPRGAALRCPQTSSS